MVQIVEENIQEDLNKLPKWFKQDLPDMKKIKPFILTMPDNNFWALGDCVGKAWNAGKKLKKSKE